MTDLNPAAETPVASVIIVGYMDRKFVDDCLKSVLAQDMPQSQYEVILGDNASPDGTADHIEKHYPQVRLVRFPKNYGFSEGNNRATPYARGRYIVYLNLDTIAHRSWLSEMVKAMQANPRLGACYSNQIVPLAPEFEKKDLTGCVDHTYLPVVSPFGFMEVLTLPYIDRPVPTLFLSGGSFMIDRKVLDELGFLFDEEYFIYAEDLDLGLRVFSLGYEVALVPSSILYHDTGTSIHKPSGQPDYGAKARRKLVSVLRNRFITYYKNMHTLEFLLYLPVMLIGAPLKARQVRWGWQRQALILLGTVPFVAYSFLSALARLPRFRAKRAFILANRSTDRFWLLRALLTRYPPLPEGGRT